MAEPTTGEKLLTRLRGPGITGNQFIDTAPGLQSLYDYATTPSAVKDIANQLGKYVDQGFMTPDEAFVELRTQVEGRRGGTGVSSSNIPQTATSGANGGASADSQARIELLTGLGYSPLQAAYLVANNLDEGILGLDLLKGAQGFGGSGGGRTQFPSEAALQEAQARQANAEADILTGGSRLRPGPGGLYYDALTGQTVDPSTAGLGDRQIAQNRYNTDVNAGVETRGQDITQQLGLLGAQNTATRNASDAAVGLGNLGVARTDQIRQILSNPSDALARLYMQRGGVSPVDRITQADLLNAFNKNIRGINDSYNSMLQGGPAGGGGGGTRLNLPLPIPQKPPTPSAPAGFNSTDPNNPGGFTDPNSDTYQNDGWFNTPEEQQAVMTQNEVQDTWGPGGADSYGLTEAISQLQEEANRAAGHATGGYTTDKVFLGNEKGSELFINPTGAPLAIVPHHQTSRLVNPDGKVKGYDEGTASSGRNTRLQAQPTGGFWNSLGETLGGLGNTLADASIRGNTRLQKDMTENPMAFMMGHGGEGKAAEEAMGIAKNQGEAMLAKINQMLGENGALDKLWLKAHSNAGSEGIKPEDYWKTFDRIYQIKEYLEQKLGKGQIGRYGPNESKLLADPMRAMDPNVSTDLGLFDTSINQVPLPLPKHAAGTLFGMPTNGVNQVGGYNPSDLGDYGDVTQQGLVDYARQAAGPGANAAITGGSAQPFAIPGVGTTARSFNQLSGGEKQALSTRLAVEFNSTLDDLVHQLQQRYSTGPSRKARLLQ